MAFFGFFFSLAVLDLASSTFIDGCLVVEVSVSAPSQCADSINPRTGHSDCPSRKHLCNNTLYYNVMTQQCPVTCNRCVTHTCFDKINPKTGISDCPLREHQCQNTHYRSLMRMQCPVTCGYCQRPPHSLMVTQAPLVKGYSDILATCPFQAACGYCITYQYQMYSYCPRSCGYCI